MGIYIFFYSINFLLSQIYFKIRKRKIIFLSFIFLNLFLCLNYDNGIDWTHYQATFSKVPPLFSNNYLKDLKEINIRGSEVLFVYLISFFKLIPNLNYEIFQYIILTIDLIIIYKFLIKNTNYPLLVILYSTKFLTYIMLEPILRQLQALVIFLISIEIIKKRKIINFYLLNIIAILFHSSAIVLLPTYFFEKIKFNIKKTLLIFSIVILVICNLEIILKVVFKIEFLSHYEVYFKSEIYGYNKKLDYFSLVKILLKDIGLLYGVYFLKNKYKVIIKNYDFISWCFFYFIIIRLLSLKVTAFFRFNNYFDLMYIIYLCFLFDLLKNKYLKRVLIVILFLYFGNLYLDDINSLDNIDRGRFKPYSNYLFVKKENARLKILNRIKKINDIEQKKEVENILKKIK